MRPFPVDVDVMQRIRPMEGRDVPAVARMHAIAMGTSLWARLGEGFLEALYGALVRDPAFLGFVYEEEGRVRGFIAGTTDARVLLRRTAIRRGFRLVRPALRGLRHHPDVLRALLTTPLYFRRSDPAAHVRAESFFCSFEPDLRGRRVAGHINKVLFDLLALRGHRAVKVTTEVDNVGANRQLRSWGFEEQGTFGFYGKPMVVYVLDLVASPRVSARAWCDP